MFLFFADNRNKKQINNYKKAEVVISKKQTNDDVNLFDKKIPKRLDLKFSGSNFKSIFENYNAKINNLENKNVCFQRKVVPRRKHRPQLPRMSLEEGNSGRKRF